MMIAQFWRVVMLAQQQEVEKLAMWIFPTPDLILCGLKLRQDDDISQVFCGIYGKDKWVS